MATTKKAAKTAVAGVPNRFQKILASTGQEVLDQRATVMANKTLQAMTNKLQELRSKRDDIILAKLNLTDLSVESKDSLRPGNANFQPRAWVDQLVKLEYDLEILEDEISVAERVAEEYFGIAPETTEE